MKITYVLDRPELSGGVKVVFQHAQLLRSQGYQVTVLGQGPTPHWSVFEGAYIDYSQKLPRLVSQDLVIGTYWTSIPIAEALGVGPVIHFCQGYEGDYPHLAAVRPEIEAVYQRKLPTLVVSPHLGELMRDRFGRDSYITSPPLDTHFRPSLRLGPRRNPWIVIHGIFECDWKGVQTGLKAVCRLREMGLTCKLLRVGVLPLSQEEKEILVPDRYLQHEPPRVIAREMRRCDLLLFPSLPTEGFGLPLLEAMISKVPAVASDIPSTRFIGNRVVPLVPQRDADAFAHAAYRLLRDSGLWRRTRRQGYSAAKHFRPRAITQQLVSAVSWAIQRSNQKASSKSS